VHDPMVGTAKAINFQNFIWIGREIAIGIKQHFNAANQLFGAQKWGCGIAVHSLVNASIRMYL